MASAMTLDGTRFGGTQGSGHVHLWFTPDNPHSCATDATTINWARAWHVGRVHHHRLSDTAVSFQVPPPSGPHRQLGTTVGAICG
jgi:hypothetical protein